MLRIAGRQYPYRRIAMRTIVMIGLGLVLGGLLVCPSAAAPKAEDEAKDEAPNEKAEQQALAAAEAWLKIVDEGKYAESWDAAAEYLKNAVGKEAFVKALDGARKPLGALDTRKLKSKEFRTSLPGAPDGQYVVIQYETSFANKKSAIETITPMLDKNGKWRVSGYYIK
jgi:hypothetical protein